MFNPIENGTIFEMTLAVILGIILGVCINMLYFRLQMELGYDPTEKGGYIKMAKHFAHEIRGFASEFFRRG